MPPLAPHGTGETYWRSLEELSGSPEFRRHLEVEFPSLLEGKLPATSRRNFLKVMGASMALAGMAGCRWPKENIVPFVTRPSGRTPGEPNYYATTIERAGVALGVLATSVDGRPIKIEGNPEHPGSHGATDSMTQASVLALYDPDRSKGYVEQTGGQPHKRTISEFVAFAEKHFGAARTSGGNRIAVLSEASESPTFQRVQAQFSKAFPQSSWYEYEPVSWDAEREGTKLAFGRPLRTIWDFSAASRIVSFDCDFLLNHPAAVKYMRAFAATRTAADGEMSRLYQIESTVSLTGMNADERYAVRGIDIPALALSLCGLLAARGIALPGMLGDRARSAVEDLPRSADHPPAAYLEDLADDIAAHRDQTLFVAGDRQPPAVHALVAALNDAVGATGRSVRYVPAPGGDRPSHVESIRALCEAIRDDLVDTLVILGGNPVYNAPADLKFAERLGKAPTSIHLSPYVDETSSLVTWHVPQSHYLETWGDGRAWDGTISMQQPLVAPLYSVTRSASELLALLAAIGDDNPDAAGLVDTFANADPAFGSVGYQLTRETFFANLNGATDREAAWRTALHDGVSPKSAWAMSTPRVQSDFGAVVENILDHHAAPSNDLFELVFAADNKLGDGRLANNGWLQELPDPVTKLTWDNAALMSPVDAKRLGLKRNNRISLNIGERSLTLPVFILPGHAPGSITLPLGYGRDKAAGPVAAGSGFDAYALRTTDGFHAAAAARVKNVRFNYKLSSTQDHQAMTTDVGQKEIQKRIPMLVRSGTLKQYKEHPEFVNHIVHSLPQVQMYQPFEYDGKHAWGMTIDLTKCTGCSACVVACQAENNIPVVGKEEVAVGREMQWLRIDRYFAGDPEDTNGVRYAVQPMPCQQCENAPCEPVCPVAATVHDEEGLNAMVYNRCIGTRYCLNNCPFKVRRFNWFYNHHGPKHPRNVKGWAQTKLTEIEKLVLNPQVTVRSRGVMEKCTFCTQRIQNAKIKARNTEVSPVAGTEVPYRILDGAIQTACQQVCPAEAITFGDLKDQNSTVARSQQEPRAYELLEHLNVKARTRYLAKLRNPLHDDAEHHGGGHGGGSQEADDASHGAAHHS